MITAINFMRQDGLLSDSQDMSAYILKIDTQNKSLLVLERFPKLEQFILRKLSAEGCTIDYKEWNEAALAAVYSRSACLPNCLKLFVSESYLTADIRGRRRPVVKFSKSFQDTLSLLKSKGYQPVSASVNYVVAWQGENDPEETAVILPTVGMRRAE